MTGTREVAASSGRPASSRDRNSRNRSARCSRFGVSRSGRAGQRRGCVRSRHKAAGRHPAACGRGSDVGPVSGLGEMRRHQAQLSGLVVQTPAADRLRRDAAVRKRDDQRRARAVIRGRCPATPRPAGQDIGSRRRSWRRRIRQRRTAETGCGSNPAPAIRRETGSRPGRGAPGRCRQRADTALPARDAGPSPT